MNQELMSPLKFDEDLEQRDDVVNDIASSDLIGKPETSDDIEDAVEQELLNQSIRDAAVLLTCTQISVDSYANELELHVRLSQLLN